MHGRHRTLNSAGAGIASLTGASLRGDIRSAPAPHANARRSATAPLLGGLSPLALFETVLPMLVLVAVVLARNLGPSLGGVHSFLEIRVTLKNVMLCALALAGCRAVLVACGLYDRRGSRSREDELTRVFAASTGCALIVGVFPLTTHAGGTGFADLPYVWTALVAAEVLLRGGRRVVAHRNHRRSPRRVIVAGTGPRALPLWEHFSVGSAGVCELVGFVDSHRPGPYAHLDHLTLGTIDDLERLLMTHAVDDVLIALPIRSRYQEIERVIRVCERVGVRANYHLDVFTTALAWPGMDPDRHSMVTMNVAPSDHRVALKRVFDWTGATCLVIALSPVMVLAALAIKLTSPGPVFFAQERCGLNRRRFRMLKFRTMVANADALQATLESKNEADGPVFKIADDPRITAVGRFLRKTSIDELPQLFNVLKGEMSLVGPRPLPLRDVQRFRRGTDMRRFSVKPGLTGLWQISGRSSLAFGEWVRLDLKYIDGWSLAEDLRILVQTIPAVLRGTGAV